jgi:hypothetical protein
VAHEKLGATRKRSPGRAAAVAHPVEKDGRSGDRGEYRQGIHWTHNKERCVDATIKVLCAASGWRPPDIPRLMRIVQGFVQGYACTWVMPELCWYYRIKARTLRVTQA